MYSAPACSRSLGPCLTASIRSDTRRLTASARAATESTESRIESRAAVMVLVALSAALSAAARAWSATLAMVGLLTGSAMMVPSEAGGRRSNLGSQSRENSFEIRNPAKTAIPTARRGRAVTASDIEPTSSLDVVLRSSVFFDAQSALFAIASDMRLRMSAAVRFASSAKDWTLSPARSAYSDVRFVFQFMCHLHWFEQLRVERSVRLLSPTRQCQHCGYCCRTERHLQQVPAA